MGIRMVGKIFDYYPGDGGEFTLALALADYAHDDGTHVFPSVAELARKTRQSERSVQYQLRSMQKAGWLLLVKKEIRPRGPRDSDGTSTGKAREYRINPAWLAACSGAKVGPVAFPPSGATIAPESAYDRVQPLHPSAPRSGATIAPEEPPALGCKTQQRSGAKLLHPNHQLTNKSKEGKKPPAELQPRTPQPQLLAAAAWAEVRSAVRAGDKPPAWSYPITDQVLREIGGFGQLGAHSERELEFRGNDFKAIFKLRAMSVSPAKSEARGEAA